MNHQDSQTTHREFPHTQAREEESVPPENQQLSHEQLLLTLQDAQAKADQHWNQLLLARAEAENIRRRAERDVEGAHKYALERFVNELVPVKDSLELGLVAAGDSQDVAKIREGMELTLKMLSTVLEKFGVKALDPKGEKFNPDLHQAMAMQEVRDVEPNVVLTVYQKGYLLNDRLIRPAMVVVSRPTAGSQPPPSADEKT